MKSTDLIEVARARLNDRDTISEANLRRATSDLYYAMFHTLCEALVEPIGLRADDAAFNEIHTHLYRTPNHGGAERRCNAASQDKELPTELRSFARHFVTMKNKRETSDYDPLAQIDVSVVRNDLEITETRCQEFKRVDPVIRTAFARNTALRKG